MWAMALAVVGMAAGAFCFEGMGDLGEGVGKG